MFTALQRERAAGEICVAFARRFRFGVRRGNRHECSLECNALELAAVRDARFRALLCSGLIEVSARGRDRPRCEVVAIANTE
jgi:hypothetical protein